MYTTIRCQGGGRVGNAGEEPKRSAGGEGGEDEGLSGINCILYRTRSRTGSPGAFLGQKIKIDEPERSRALPTPQMTRRKPATGQHAEPGSASSCRYGSWNVGGRLYRRATNRHHRRAACRRGSPGGKLKAARRRGRAGRPPATAARRRSLGGGLRSTQLSRCRSQAAVSRGAAAVQVREARSRLPEHGDGLSGHGRQRLIHVTSLAESARDSGPAGPGDVVADELVEGAERVGEDAVVGAGSTAKGQRIR